LHRIVGQVHDYLGLLLDFHWRETIRTDWRPDQVAIIDGLIHGAIKGLGVVDANPDSKEVAENRQSHLPGRTTWGMTGPEISSSR